MRYGTEKICFLAPKIWDILRKDLQDSESLDIFKRKSNNGFHRNALAEICKTYAPQVGFI